MEKLAIGIAAYGPQPAEWWAKFALMCGTLHNYNIQLDSIITANTMATDHNRNAVVKSFLSKDAEWLLWVDTDNLIPLGGVRRLLDTGKKLVTGLYYLKSEPYRPVAFTREPDNRYKPIENWRRGELLQIDMAGMGCCLTHRSVYDDIRDQTTVTESTNGHLVVLHNTQIKGEIKKEIVATEGYAEDGIYKLPLYLPNHEDDYPYFMSNYLRTEDVHFYEVAQLCGYQAWCDTSVEVEHLGMRSVTGETYRKHMKETQYKTTGVKDYILGKAVSHDVSS
jgi:hypothetical protein